MCVRASVYVYVCVYIRTIYYSRLLCYSPEFVYLAQVHGWSLLHFIIYL